MLCVRRRFINYKIRNEMYATREISLDCGVGAPEIVVLGSENAFIRGTLGFPGRFNARKALSNKGLSDFLHFR